MSKADPTSTAWMLIRVTGGIGFAAAALVIAMIAGARVAFADVNPNAGDDAAVREAVQGFDTAQQAASAAAPANRTSKALEDKLDEAIRNQEAVEADPNATQKQKDDARDARDKAQENADFFNENVRDPDAAETYREKLEERRAARAKLLEQQARWMKARKAPRTAARALQLIRSRMRLANERPPASEQVGLVVPPRREAEALAAGPSLGDLRGMQDSLASAQTQPAVFVPYVPARDPGARSQRAGEHLMSGLALQRERAHDAHDAHDAGHYPAPEPEPEPEREIVREESPGAGGVYELAPERDLPWPTTRSMVDLELYHP